MRNCSVQVISVDMFSWVQFLSFKGRHSPADQASCTPIPLFHPIVAATLQNDSVLGNFALAFLPVVLFIWMFYFLFRRKIAALLTKLSAPSVDNPQGGPHHHHPLAKLYFRAIGFVVANTIGKLSHYDKRHVAFLTSGSVCQQCGETLLNRSWMPLVRCFDSAGNPVSLTEASKKGAEFECPQCHFRWPIRNNA